MANFLFTDWYEGYGLTRRNKPPNKATLTAIAAAMAKARAKTCLPSIFKILSKTLYNEINS
ncbi:hypothetical protein [Escherichia coli]|uniref:hypothetical protein n=1 Tax=Escherichia coli TaxID=562 RepID=UPI001C60D98F|nr:hypothetical protein [Escherichia coli]